MFLFSTYKGNVKIGQVKRLLESVEAQIMGNCLKSPEKLTFHFFLFSSFVGDAMVETVLDIITFLYCFTLPLALNKLNSPQ